MMDLLIKATMVVTLLIATYLLVVEPSMNCWAVNGTPVRGFLMMECVKP